MSYLKQVWQLNKALGWLLLINIVLISFVSIGFTGHFPEAVSTLDAAYQVGVIPAVWGLYALVAIIILLPFTFIPYANWPLQVFLLAVAGNLAVIVFIDSYIYDIYSYHINWFFIEAFLADEGGEFFDVSPKTYVLFTAVSALIAAVEFFLLWLVNKRIIPRRRFKGIGWVFAILVFVNILFVNLTHSWAYAQNYMPITSLSGHIPFYFPMHSRSIAKSDMLDNMAGDGASVDSSNIVYPKNDMQCSAPASEKPNIIMVVLESWRADTMDAEVSPNTYALAQDSLWFKDHHSSGTVTTRGIFSLMYGLAPTYMDNVVSHNGVGGPVLLNELKRKGYEFGVYPSGDITRIKLTDTSFLPVKPDVHHGEGEGTIEKDRDVLNKMITKLESTDESIFGFMFFNSTHYLYYYPEEFGKFQPSKKPSLVDFKSGKDPQPYINRYKNSIYFIDHLVGELVAKLKEMGKYDNTILIVTSDHAEEFADTSPTRFGHGSNYTKYQTHVPLVIHWPGKEPRVFDHRTASIDVSPTLIDELLGCENPMDDYGNGISLFDEVSRDVQVMASYYNYAFVTKEGSFIQNPIGLLESRDNEDQLSADLKLNPAAAFKALQQMKTFYSNKAAQ
jgi:membrane-anchored protein YejM (alkaline phosphatase superfamily)